MRFDLKRDIVERLGMLLIALGVISWIFVVVLSSLELISQWFWLLPGILTGGGMLTLILKALYDRFNDDDNTKYGDIKN